MYDDDDDDDDDDDVLLFFVCVGVRGLKFEASGDLQFSPNCFH